MKFSRVGLIIIWLAGATSAYAAPVCDGTTDDTAAILAVGIAGQTLPSGTCRITSSITLTATGSYSAGLRLHGAGMYRTTILADYNGDPTLGGIISLTTAGSLQFSIGTEISDLSIKQASGRTGLNGIQLTSAWFVTINRVYISGLSGTGILVPLRNDISPGLSDPYQGYSIVISQSWIAQSAGWGINFGAGQSPGLYKIEYSTIANNAGGGIRSTTGQCQINANTIVGNGTYGGNGGLLFDTVEGPQFVARVTQNEFQDNYNWHVNLLRSRGAEIQQNRFLSQTYSSDQGGSPAVGSTHMRPLVHVNLGSGSTNEVYDLIADHNYHRTVSGSGTTTAQVIAYDASSGALSPNFPVHIRYNDFGPMPPDGTTQNSTGLIKFVNFSGSGAEIIDP